MILAKTVYNFKMQLNKQNNQLGLATGHHSNLFLS